MIYLYTCNLRLACVLASTTIEQFEAIENTFFDVDAEEYLFIIENDDL